MVVNYAANAAAANYLVAKISGSEGLAIAVKADVADCAFIAAQLKLKFCIDLKSFPSASV